MRDFGFTHRPNMGLSLSFWYSGAAIIAARKIMGKNKNDDTKNVDFIVDDIKL